MKPALQALDGIISCKVVSAREIVRALTVDLGGVDFLDSSGLGALVAGLKLARSRSGELRIVCDQQRSVRKVLEVTGLERVLERFDSVDDAAAA